MSKNNILNSVIQVNYLTNIQWSLLDWRNGTLNYPGMGRKRTIGDGSCFFHAITDAYFRPYQRGNLNGKSLNRIKFVKYLRYDLANELERRINPNGRMIYDKLSRGKLREISKTLQQYSLENMQKELRSNRSVDNVYLEFISNVLDKDIYILDFMKKDVYITGDDRDILYKNRDSIVLLFIPGHYELVGVKEQGKIKTLFKANHPFITSIVTRMNEKIKLGARI